MVQFLESFQFPMLIGGAMATIGEQQLRNADGRGTCPSAERFGRGSSWGSSCSLLREAQGSQDALCLRTSSQSNIMIWRCGDSKQRPQTNQRKAMEFWTIESHRILLLATARTQGPPQEHFRCHCCPLPLSLFPSFLSLPNPISTFLFPLSTRACSSILSFFWRSRTLLAPFLCISFW